MPTWHEINESFLMKLGIADSYKTQDGNSTGRRIVVSPSSLKRNEIFCGSRRSSGFPDFCLINRPSDNYAKLVTPNLPY